MNRTGTMAICVALGMAGAASAQRTWIIENYQLQDGPFSEVQGGNFGGGNYHWSSSSGHGIQRAFWKFDFPDVPAEPRLYLVEQWVPDVMPDGVTSWTGFQPIEVTFRTDCNDCEEGQGNTCFQGNCAYWDYIPWKGQFGTNHQWIKVDEQGFNQPPLGRWEPTGPGPQAPDGDDCDAWGDGPQSIFLWMQRGSTLYKKWTFPWAITAPVTALRITEVSEPDPPDPCGTPVFSEPLDLRCVGNADPLYTLDQFYSTDHARNVEGNTLGVEGYFRPTCFDPNPALTPGLPVDGVYTAQLPEGDVTFQLRYEDLNAIKWRDTPTGPFSKFNEVTLNETPNQDFVAGHYGVLHFLSIKAGGTNGRLKVEATYGDDTTSTHFATLYDWFNQDGDAVSRAVGVGGELRDGGIGQGFRRLNNEGGFGNGGDGSGAFFVVHSIEVDPNKTLRELVLSIDETEGAFGGNFVIVAATFEPGLACSTPVVFDVAGAGPGGTEPDGAVDQQDFAAFQRCLNDGSEPFDPPECGCFDVTGDGRIDGDDFAFFLACYTGPTPASPPPVGCDQP